MRLTHRAPRSPRSTPPFQSTTLPCAAHMSSHDFVSHQRTKSVFSKNDKNSFIYLKNQRYFNQKLP